MDTWDPVPPVFVTVGTDHHPFDRLIGWVDSWLGRRSGPSIGCLVQTGTARLPRVAQGAAYMPYREIERTVVGAGVVVAHAGSGTVQMCRRLGRKPIVVARRMELGEHIDDHQVRFAQRMAAEGYIWLAGDEATFVDMVEAGLAGRISLRPSPGEDRAEQVLSRFGQLVDELVAPGKALPRRG